MIAEAFIRQIVEGIIKEEVIFLVDVYVTPANKITILVDSPEGITIDQCAEINKKMELRLDRNEEDYELVVSSPGLASGLKVIEQYRKNIGRELEIIMKDQSRYNGILTSVAEKEIIIKQEVRQSGKDSHKTGTMEGEQKIILDDIRTAKVRIIFNHNKNG